MTPNAAPHLPPDAAFPDRAARVRAGLGTRAVVLIGMMGAGKSSVGRRLGKLLDLPFVDADTEIEKAAGMTIPDIFARHGEEYFRAGEVRVLARLLEEGGTVIATGGGAWMNPMTRAHIGRCGISVWLKADADLLMRRVRKRGNRPLLKTDDPDATLRNILAEREPAYAEADVTLVSRDVPQESMAVETLQALDAYLQEHPQT
ncbi:shikimate kinase [Terrihabitans sp. B22-R8]|uniref:shikimate kinase n=1 Tax=Terrihabitans sp. B22-R8 TaxID=3425128 RepID=UPI00403CCEA2